MRSALEHVAEVQCNHQRRAGTQRNHEEQKFRKTLSEKQKNWFKEPRVKGEKKTGSETQFRGTTLDETALRYWFEGTGSEQLGIKQVQKNLLIETNES